MQHPSIITVLHTVLHSIVTRERERRLISCGHTTSTGMYRETSSVQGYYEHSNGSIKSTMRIPTNQPPATALPPPTNLHVPQQLRPQQPQQSQQQPQQQQTTSIDPLHTLIASSSSDVYTYGAYQAPQAPQQQQQILYTTKPQVSTIVTGPNGQPMIVGPAATATLLQSHPPAPYLTSTSTGSTTAATSTTTTTTSNNPPQPQRNSGAIPTLTQSSTHNNTTTATTTAPPPPPHTALLVSTSTTAAPIAPDLNASSHLRVTAMGGTSTAPVPTNMANKSGLTPEERRRQERNLREQQRSHRISQQICELKNVLVESNVPFKPNKFNVLMSVVEYIKQLQARAVFLDGEHQKLIQTIQQTTNYVSNNNNNNNNNTNSTNNNNNTSNNHKRSAVSDIMMVSKKSRVGNDSDLLFVQGLDYQAVFSQCNAPLGVAALDGRFLACNLQFQIITGCSQEQLNRLSLFNLVKNQDVEQVFKVMGEMLKSKPNNKNNHTSPQENNHIDPNKNGESTSTCTTTSSSPTHWTGLISQYHNNQPNMPVSIIM